MGSFLMVCGPRASSTDTSRKRTPSHPSLLKGTRGFLVTLSLKLEKLTHYNYCNFSFLIHGLTDVVHSTFSNGVVY